MSDTVIKVENLGKKYILSHRQEGRSQYRALRDVISDGTKSLGNKLISPFSKQPILSPEREEFWALKDVSFEIKRGDRVGIIGRNGAGKSTLLKILSRITEPTTGKISIKGRVASLLEVGTGFHPELTGRENIFLNGAVLGMSKAEIKQKFDEIVDFAEVEKFLDTPVKRYSSGMYVRLAFAVAAFLEPEILVVDEVLAVGDLAFQKKCIGKMDEVSKQEGKTIILVSHNMDAVRKLCNFGLLLNKGTVINFDKTEITISEYINNEKDICSIYELPPPSNSMLPGYASKIIIETIDGIPAPGIAVDQPWRIKVQIKISKNLEHFIIALGLQSSQGYQIRTSWSHPQAIEQGDYEVIFQEDHIYLAPDIYTVMLGLSENEQTFQYFENVGKLRILDFTQDIDLVRITNVGLILNPFKIYIEKCKPIAVNKS